MALRGNLTQTCGTGFSQNITNGIVANGPDTAELLAHLDQLVSGALIFFATLPFVLFNCRFVPLGTTPALLFGATFMVLAHVVPQNEVYESIGKQHNLTFIFLVVGLMLIVHFLEREQLLTVILRHFLTSHLTFENYIWRVCLLSFLLSAFFTSDACGAILTPTLLALWEVQERQNVELETIVLAIATSANIGSVATIFGSAHISLLASKTTGMAYNESALDLRRSLLYLLPATVLAFFINLGFLVCHYRIRSRDIQKSKLISEASISEQEMSGLTRTHGSGDLTQLNGTLKPSNGVLRYNGGDEITYEEDTDSTQEDRLSVPCQLETILEDEVLEITSSRSTSVMDNDALSCDTDPPSQATENDEVTNLSGSSSDEDEPRNPVHAQSSCDTRLQESNSLTMDIEYVPSALQSQDLSSRSVTLALGSPSATSPTQTLEQKGLKLSEKAGIYRSTTAVSSVGLLPVSGDLETAFPSSDSRLFQVFVAFMYIVVLVLNLASTTEAVVFDLGMNFRIDKILFASTACIFNSAFYLVHYQLLFAFVAMFYNTVMHSRNK